MRRTTATITDGYKRQHDACQSDRALGVGDDEVVRAQLELLRVEQRELLARGGAAHNNMIGDVIGVKSVRRVAGGEHHVVGDIDKGVDRAHAGLPDAALHLVGGGLDRHAGHFHADVPRAAVGIVDLHLEVGLHFRLVGFNLFERQIVKRCEFARDAVVTPEVGAVRHGLVVDLEEHIVQIEGLGQRRAGRSVKRGEIENFGLLRSGEEVAQTCLLNTSPHLRRRSGAPRRRRRPGRDSAASRRPSRACGRCTGPACGRP